jgi:hypothetical protein
MLAVADPKEGFYQAVAALLFGLLIGGLTIEANRAREAERRRGSNGQLGLFRADGAPSRPWRAYTAIGLLVVILLGEFGAIFDLAIGPSPEWVQWPVLACTSIGLVGVPILVFDVFFAQAGLNGQRFVKRVAAIVLVSCGAYAAVRVIVVGKAYVSPLSGPYSVGGTCADLDCGLRQHVAPTTESPYSPKLLQDGSLVHIKCQTLAAPVRLKRGRAESSIWDLLSSGYYVSDLFVNTTRYGTFDPQIPRCPGSPAAPGAGRERVG